MTTPEYNYNIVWQTYTKPHHSDLRAGKIVTIAKALVMSGILCLWVKTLKAWQPEAIMSYNVVEKRSLRCDSWCLVLSCGVVYFLYKVVVTLGLWIKTLSVATQNESYGMLPSYSSVYYPVQESFFLLTVWMKLQLRPLKSYKVFLMPLFTCYRKRF